MIWLQVEAVLGTDSSPRLPADTVDMAFMHHVYHHFSKPREMLRGIWQSLKPGGYLVIVDQRLGTLVDWVPREQRAGKHYWIAETTVVREARETGYLFVDYAEPLWHTRDSFVLIFQCALDPLPLQTAILTVFRRFPAASSPSCCRRRERHIGASRSWRWEKGAS